MDRIKYLIYKLGRFKFIDQCYRAYYALALKLVKHFLNKKDYVHQVALKGSYLNSQFIPIVSDLDFFICGEVNDTNKKNIERLFQRLHRFFPMVLDFDFHTLDETDILCKFGGYKFFEVHDWISLKGIAISGRHRYHPKKYVIDILHEIYFQFEWLFKNLKSRSKHTPYKSLCIYRQFLKVQTLIKHLENPRKGYQISEKFKFDKKWLFLTNEEIIVNFNHLLTRCSVITEFVSIFQRELNHISLDIVLEESYYQKQLEFIDQGFKYTFKKHYFTKNNFKLFFFIGSVDSKVLYELAENQIDIFSKNFLKGLYFSRLIQGRENYRDKKGNLTDFKQDFKSIHATINPMIYHCAGHLNLYRGEEVIVLPVFNMSGIGIKLLQDFITDFTKLPEHQYRLLVVRFIGIREKNKQLKLINASNIDHLIFSPGNEEALQIDQVLPFLKISLGWLFCAKNLLLWDLKAHCPSKIFFDSLFLDLEKFAFTQLCPENKRDNFIWAGSIIEFTSQKRFLNLKTDLFLNDFFYYSNRGEFHNLPNSELFLGSDAQNIFSEKKALNYRTDALSTWSFERGFNLFYVRQLVFKYMLKQSVYDSAGFLYYSRDQKFTLELFYFFAKVNDLSEDAILFELDRIFSNHEIESPPLFELSLFGKSDASFVGFNGGYGLLGFTDSHHIELKTGKFSGLKEFHAFKSFCFSSQYSEGLYFVELKVSSRNFNSNETGTLKLKPAGVEKRFSQEKIVGFKSKSYFFAIELAPSVNHIDFDFSGYLDNDNVYRFELEQIYSFDELTGFDFYKKQHNQSPSWLLRGMYKVVINFKTEVNRIVSIETESGEKSKKLEIINQKISVCYFAINEDSDVHFKISDNAHELESIDILRKELT